MRVEHPLLLGFQCLVYTSEAIICDMFDPFKQRTLIKSYCNIDLYYFFNLFYPCLLPDNMVHSLHNFVLMLLLRTCSCTVKVRVTSGELKTQ